MSLLPEKHVDCTFCSQIGEMQAKIVKLEQALADAKREGVLEFLEWMFKLNGVEFGKFFGMFANKMFDEIIQNIEEIEG